MANEKYKVNSDNLNTLSTELLTIISDYRDQVLSLQSLANDIDSSNAWIDKDLKPPFVKNLNSYVGLYKKIYAGLKVYRRYVIRKGRHADEIENIFSK